MSTGSLLTSNFAPEALYAGFEQFLENHQAMVRYRGLDYTWVYMLVRLARDDAEKGRRVFNWAVKRVCVDMLANGERKFGPALQEISPKGLFWANRAEQLFGVDPARSLSLVEGIYLLEKLSVWAEVALQSAKFRGTLVEFRKRPESNEEASGKIAWLDQFYQSARGRAAESAEEFVRRRDAAIALYITHLAGGSKPTDAEIDEAMTHRLPTHQSLAKRATEHSSPLVHGSMVSQDVIIDWTLGEYQKGISF